MNDEKISNLNDFDEKSLRSLGKQIATVRKMLGCTQSVFSEAIGITPQTLSLIERGLFELTNNLAAKIYFSLYEITNDKDLIVLSSLEDYEVMCIKDLMNNLLKYIRNLNIGLKLVIEESKTL